MSSTDVGLTTDGGAEEPEELPLLFRVKEDTIVYVGFMKVIASFG
jgi:hypothetical protein